MTNCICACPYVHTDLISYHSVAHGRESGTLRSYWVARQRGNNYQFHLLLPECCHYYYSFLLYQLFTKFVVVWCLLAVYYSFRKMKKGKKNWLRKEARYMYTVGLNPFRGVR